MLRRRMLSSIRMAALGAAVTLAFGSVAWGQAWGRYDNGDYSNRHDEASEHGYKNGYRDGLRAGQSDSERGRRFKFKNDDWEDAHGYERWMGDHGQYKHAYREAYENGYRRGYGYYGGRYRDRDDYRWHDRDDWR
jgi:hypothetical protein